MTLGDSQILRSIWLKVKQIELFLTSCRLLQFRAIVCACWANDLVFATLAALYLLQCTKESGIFFAQTEFTVTTNISLKDLVLSSSIDNKRLKSPLPKIITCF